MTPSYPGDWETQHRSRPSQALLAPGLRSAFGPPGFFLFVFFNCSSSDFSFCLSLIDFHLKVLNQFYSSRGTWADPNPEDERESPRALKPGNRSEVLSLLLYDPEGDINWIRNVVPKEEGGVPLPSTLPKDVYLTLMGGWGADIFGFWKSPHASRTSVNCLSGNDN